MERGQIIENLIDGFKGRRNKPNFINHEVTYFENLLAPKNYKTCIGCYRVQFTSSEGEVNDVVFNFQQEIENYRAMKRKRFPVVPLAYPFKYMAEMDGKREAIVQRFYGYDLSKILKKNIKKIVNEDKERFLNGDVPDYFEKFLKLMEKRGELLGGYAQRNIFFDDAASLFNLVEHNDEILGIDYDILWDKMDDNELKFTVNAMNDYYFLRTLVKEEEDFDQAMILYKKIGDLLVDSYYGGFTSKLDDDLREKVEGVKKKKDKDYYDLNLISEWILLKVKEHNKKNPINMDIALEVGSPLIGKTSLERHGYPLGLVLTIERASYQRIRELEEKTNRFLDINKRQLKESVFDFVMDKAESLINEHGYTRDEIEDLFMNKQFSNFFPWIHD